MHRSLALSRTSAFVALTLVLSTGVYAHAAGGPSEGAGRSGSRGVLKAAKEGFVSGAKDVLKTGWIGYVKVGTTLQYINWPSLKMMNLAGQAAHRGEMLKSRALVTAASATGVVERLVIPVLFVGAGHALGYHVAEDPMTIAKTMAVPGGIMLATSPFVVIGYNDTYATGRYIDAPAKDLATLHNVPFDVARFQVISDLQERAAANEARLAAGGASEPAKAAKPSVLKRMFGAKSP